MRLEGFLVFISPRQTNRYGLILRIAEMFRHRLVALWCAGAATMRRFISLTIAFAPLYGCHTLSGQQPQSLPPITVKVEMPPQNSWIRLLEILLSGVVGATSALLATYLTNKRNASESAANRQHQLRLEAAKVERAFRKEVYVNLITTVHNMAKNLHDLREAVNLLRSNPTQGLGKLARKTIEAEGPELATNVQRLTTEAALAPLATANVLPLLQAAQGEVFSREIDFNAPDAPSLLQRQLDATLEMLTQLQAAGRKDLWDLLGPETKADAAAKA
jgi:hypothetical protein